MPRSRRRHHSRSRSRSNSHDRDREPKRRKVESFDSLHNRGSVSSEPEANENVDNALNDCPIENIDAHSDLSVAESATRDDNSCPPIMASKTCDDTLAPAEINSKITAIANKPVGVNAVNKSVHIDDRYASNEESNIDDNNVPQINEDTNSDDGDMALDESNTFTDLDSTRISVSSGGDSSPGNNPDTSITDANSSLSSVNPSLQEVKPLTPKQLKRKLESEERRKARLLEKEERRRKIQEKRESERRQRQLEKEAKAKEEREAKEKERELKRKEKEEIKRKEKEEKEEIKRKEKEKEEAKRKEKEEAKRKEKEAERLKKQAEIDEKNREKQKIEEKKQKAAAAFTKFFVAKSGAPEVKKEVPNEEGSAPIFMPFQVKSDMRLAPTTRNVLTLEEKEHLVNCLLKDECCFDYLKQLKEVPGRKCCKTWVAENGEDDDVVLREKDLGESILKSSVPAATVMKSKFFKFHENRRPPYYGTWRKKSKCINGRRPLSQDDIFNYEIDSDDEWEEEEEGEDIGGSEDEEKEPDTETDYEVDDEFFVPHGHLSDDEENDDEENISPEMRKAKEKLLKNQFDEERKSQTQKLKPRVIGCVWYNNNEDEDCGVDEAIHKFLKPFSIISNGIIPVKSRADMEVSSKYKDELPKELMPEFLRLLHGNVNKKSVIATEYIAYLTRMNVDVILNKALLIRLIKRIAQWRKCTEDGPMLKKLCWNICDEVRAEYKHVELTLPNEWEYGTDVKLRKSSSSIVAL